MDQKLFPLINAKWTSPALDSFMATLSSFAAWAPLLLIIAALVAVRGGFKARAMLAVLAIVIAVMDVGISDTIKRTANRPRPREAKEDVRVVDLQPGMFRFLSVFKPAVVFLSQAPAQNPAGHSLPSGHAINNFGAATVFTLFYKRRGLFYFIPAALISYSRVYVGAHWPSDVLISAFMGVGSALLLVAALELVWRKFGGRLMPRVFANHPFLLEDAA